MTPKRDALPLLYHPADVAKALGKSEWWVKEQARNQRIPYTRPGRAYRFTAEQFAEIIRFYETRPSGRPAPQPSVRTIPEPARAQALPQPARQGAPARLRARTPRRTAALMSQQQEAA